MEDKRLYKQLVQRYLDDTASKEELELFFHLLQSSTLDDLIDQQTISQTAPVKTKRRSVFIRYAAAAAVILIIATSLTLYLSKENDIQTAQSDLVAIPQALPGSKKATLVLSDGKQINLGESEQNLHDVNADITSKNNSLVYEPQPESEAVSYNTISTPRGGEYEVTLPDGTRVWLNASSALTYPTAFNGAQRTVELSGEAYFEVAKNAKQPFVVKAGQASVKVLGTHFNIMAYREESIIKTTLTEGSVAVSNYGKEVLIKPGEAATILNNKKEIEVAETNIDQDLAWKNGRFYFDKTPLPAIMNQIGRWYDLDIQYSTEIPEKRFVGKISRYTNLSDVLAVLRLSGVKFSMAGKSLIVHE